MKVTAQVGFWAALLRHWKPQKADWRRRTVREKLTSATGDSFPE